MLQLNSISYALTKLGEKHCLESLLPLVGPANCVLASYPCLWVQSRRDVYKDYYRMTERCACMHRPTAADFGSQGLSVVSRSTHLASFLPSNRPPPQRKYSANRHMIRDVSETTQISPLNDEGKTRGNLSHHDAHLFTYFLRG